MSESTEKIAEEMNEALQYGWIPFVRKLCRETSSEFEPYMPFPDVVSLLGTLGLGLTIRKRGPNE